MGCVTGKPRSKTSSTTRSKILNNSPGPFLVSHSPLSLVLILSLCLSLYLLELLVSFYLWWLHSSVLLQMDCSHDRKDGHWHPIHPYDW